jgi:hypothetical protein
MVLSFPFYHQVIDNFLDKEEAIKISQEFPEYHSNYWFSYNNPLENKKSCNNWYAFGPEIYKTFAYLNSKEFISKLQEITGIEKLYPDIGLHGGGLHIHGRGGKLNVHLFPEPLECPEGVYRKSLAVYYLTEPPEGTDPRPRALYAPTEEQENNPEILKLIEERVKL